MVGSQHPTHNEVVPLPDSTRLAIDWVIANGRNGKGCVITWAAGNGNESVDGDLVVSIKPPTSLGISHVVLHNREGRGTDNIKKAYDAVTTPALLNLNGKSPQGTWTLVVQDKEKLDTGNIRSVLLEMTL